MALAGNIVAVLIIAGLLWYFWLKNGYYKNQATVGIAVYAIGAIISLVMTDQANKKSKGSKDKKKYEDMSTIFGVIGFCGIAAAIYYRAFKKSSRVAPYRPSNASDVEMAFGFRFY